MTWRQQMVCRILLMVARIFADDPALAADIKHLSNAITNRPAEETVIEVQS